jgi:3-oxoadipate enol-lactonase
MAAVDLNARWDGPAGARPVVLSHALGQSMAMWEPQMAQLSSRFRLLRYDHRGHGGSPVPKGPYRIEDLGQDLLALLDRERLDQVSLAGLSLGGMVGMWLAANAPGRVDRLVLCCTAARMPHPDDYVARAERVRKEGLAPLADGVIGRWFTSTYLSTQPQSVARVRERFLATDPQGYAATCEALAAMDLRDQLRRITAPTLVIAAAEDQATPVPQAQEITAAIPGARLVIIPGAAHLANLEKPDEVATAMATHFTS